MRRSVAAVVMTAALAASMLALSAGPAFAGGCSGNASNAPDARYRDGGSWFGEGTYPNINFLESLGPGESLSIEAQWRNVSGITKSIRVRGFSFSKDPGMRIKIFFAGANVTSRFRGDDPGLTFKDLAPNARTGRVEIRFKNATASASTFGQQGLFGYYKGAPTTSTCDSVYAAVND